MNLNDSNSIELKILYFTYVIAIRNTYKCLHKYASTQISLVRFRAVMQRKICNVLLFKAHARPLFTDAFKNVVS